MFDLIRVNSDNNDFKDLVALLDLELNSRYGIIQAQYDKFNIINSINNVVVGYNDSKPIGCGCFKIYDKDTIEIKRMFVKTDFRGSGISKLILIELESWASDLGFVRAILETGIKQPDAIRFYNKLGYQKMDNFGQYIGNTNSVCMSKYLKRITV
jgi:GNAT superfamily N-acetyltransferase